jgi:nucleoside-diphosphate-sugar epimerase
MLEYSKPQLNDVEMPANKILVTGANGFVGRDLCRYLVEQSISFKAAVWNQQEQKDLTSLFPNIEIVIVGDIGPNTDWSSALEGINTIVHLAAASAKTLSSNASFDEFKKVNVDGVKCLVKYSYQYNVKRFIYIGTLNMYKTKKFLNRIISINDKPEPTNFYLKSKLDAAEYLEKMMPTSKMDIVILHPPFIYGPENNSFFAYIQLMLSPLFILLRIVQNEKFSIIYVKNLVDAIIKVINHPTRLSKSYFVTDGQDISNQELLEMIAKKMGKKPIYFKLPVFFLKAAKKVFLKLPFDKPFRRGNTWPILHYQFDISQIREELNWQPPFTVQEGINHLVDDFMARQKI